MPKKLAKPPANPLFPKLEKDILARWQKEGTFRKSLEKNPPSKRFTFYDGPPFATGRPHYGGLLQGTIKDVIPRFRTMQGYYVERRFGWDCHGLPVEYELEKERGLRSRQEILDMGVDVFNEACRSIVLRYTKEWEEVTTRLGRWIDFENDYKTMDPGYMESIWWVVKTLYEKNLLYEGRKSMHVCPRCATSLSNFEVTLGYRDRQDPAVFVKFPLQDEPGTSLVAWTTTPWTLPGNVLLAVNPAIDYVTVEHEGERLIVARSRLEAVFQGATPKISTSVTAGELVGRAYDAPFPITDLAGKHYEVVADDSVTEDEGSGILHVAPAFGEDDMRIGEREKAAFIQHLTMTGYLTEPFDRYHDRQALDANEPLVAELKQSDRLLRKETITHAYPHCWRCDTPLLNYATTQWFVKVTSLKDRLLAENAEISWTPEHVRDGRFGAWLEGARDWAISRQRFWGNPMPIWRCDGASPGQPGHLKVIGSLDELEQLSGERPADLHKHFVDKITFPCPECAAEMTRTEDVLDCWFESGSMPYAYGNYPFAESEEELTERFPADFIAEGLDQTRGWFYTLHVLGVALKDSKAFRNAICTGLIMAADGKKMSKSLKNYPDPENVFREYGADALRLYLLRSPVVRGENLNFSEKGVQEVYRNFTVTLWNVYSFLATYAAIADWEVAPPPNKPRNVLDRWILARLEELTTEITTSLEGNDLMTAARALSDFLEGLSNWYVRRSRRRLRGSEGKPEQAEALATLHHVLATFCRLAAPFTPFISEEVYRGLGHTESVHLADWPKAEAAHQDERLLLQMGTALKAVRFGLAARSRAGIRVRQPLSEARISLHEPALGQLDNNIVQIIQEELNVKSISLLADEAALQERLQPIPKAVADVAGMDTQAVIAAVKKGEYRRKGAMVSVDRHTFPLDHFKLIYEPRAGYVVEGNADLVVALDVTLDEALTDEGRAREVIRSVQEARKAAGLMIEDHITLGLTTEAPELTRAVDRHRALIAAETLARSLVVGESAGEYSQEVSIDDLPLTITLQKV